MFETIRRHPVRIRIPSHVAALTAAAAIAVCAAAPVAQAHGFRNGPSSRPSTSTGTSGTSTSPTDTTSTTSTTSTDPTPDPSSGTGAGTNTAPSSPSTGATQPSSGASDDDSTQDGAGSGWFGPGSSWWQPPHTTTTTSSALRVADVDVDTDSISPNGDGNDDAATLSFRLHGTGSVDVAVETPDGTVVHDLGSQTGSGWKAATWDGTGASSSVVPDGDYQFVISTNGAALGSAPESVDTVAPQVSAKRPSLAALKKAALRAAQVRARLQYIARQHHGRSHGFAGATAQDWHGSDDSDGGGWDADTQWSDWAAAYGSAVPISFTLTEPSNVTIRATVAGHTQHVDGFRDAGTQTVNVLLPTYKAGAHLVVTLQAQDDSDNTGAVHMDVPLPAPPLVKESAGDSSSSSASGAAPAVPTTVSASPAPTKGSASLPAWLQPIMLRATYGAGVPQSWATSTALANILTAESGFNATAQNPTSTAYGLFQFLNTTWAVVGGTKTSDPYNQCVYGLKYIAERYGTPEKAWTFHLAHGWY